MNYPLSRIDRFSARFSLCCPLLHGKSGGWGLSFSALDVIHNLLFAFSGGGSGRRKVVAARAGEMFHDPLFAIAHFCHGTDISQNLALVPLSTIATYFWEKQPQR